MSGGPLDLAVLFYKPAPVTGVAPGAPRLIDNEAEQRIHNVPY